MNSRRDDGEPSMRLRLPVRNITDGTARRSSVKDIDFALSLSEIRDEISALMSKLSSPETCPQAEALRFSPDHDITPEVFANAPQPVRMLNASRRLVFPAPFLPRIKLMPGAHSVLSSEPVKFLKFFTAV